jgi:hypothetical protein
MLETLSLLGSRKAVQGFLGSIAVWIVLVAIGFQFDATWPHATINVPTCFTQNPIAFRPELCQMISASDQWQTFLMLGVIAQACLFLSYMMVVMAYRWDWLCAALVGIFTAFGVLFLVGMAGMLWPRWQGVIEFRFWIRAALILIFGFAIVQLLLIPNRRRPEPAAAPHDEMAVTG